ncbi:MAG: PHP domain-containing protein, partial [candidate division Zixibacteria bacterium]|nr:PHP domain-containing protein [candidate division Zixibacteria bacterium]
MAEQTVDLHSHTSCSDGRLSPVGLVDLAVSKGLAALAITDHDTVAGVGPATAHAKELEIVPGVELSASEGNSDIHILGYFIDLESRLLIEHLEVFRSYRFLRGRQIVERLNELGVRLSFDDVLACSGGESASIGRPHVAQALVDNGYVGTLEEAFRIYLGSHAPAYVP